MTSIFSHHPEFFRKSQFFREMCTFWHFWYCYHRQNVNVKFFTSTKYVPSAVLWAAEFNNTIYNFAHHLSVFQKSHFFAEKRVNVTYFCHSWNLLFQCIFLDPWKCDFPLFRAFKSAYNLQFVLSPSSFPVKPIFPGLNLCRSFPKLFLIWR